MKTSRTSRLAVPALAMIGMAVFAGCGSSNTASSESSSSAASSSASTATSASASASVSAVATASAASTELAKESETANVEAVIPDGYQSVTAEDNKLTFAIPGDWIVVGSYEVADEAVLEEIASASGVSAEEIKAQLSANDLMAQATAPDANGFTSNIILPTPVMASALPSETELASSAIPSNATAGEYAVVDTPQGKAATLTYTMDTNGITTYGELVVVPAGGGSGYAVFVVSAGDEASRADLAKALTESVTAAS